MPSWNIICSYEEFRKNGIADTGLKVYELSESQADGKRLSVIFVGFIALISTQVSTHDIKFAM